MGTQHSGKLYVIATPIGNLKDITLRAIDVIRNVDYLLCEDTRQSLKLLNHYNIKKHLESYFVGNERHKTEKVLNDLITGKDIGLISDSGTPCISDPGNYLIQKCHDHKIMVVPVPGPSALTAALSVSGLNDQISIFIGFLPKSKKKINKLFEKIDSYEGNIVIYESPYRIQSLLKKILDRYGNVKIYLFKELTKVFESIIIDNVKNILADISSRAIKGEYVVIFNKESS